jgi:hypothetical protein
MLAGGAPSGGADGFFRRERKDLSGWSFIECFHGSLKFGADEVEIAFVDLQLIDIALMPYQRLQSSVLFPEHTYFVTGWFGWHAGSYYSASRAGAVFWRKRKAPGRPGLSVCSHRIGSGGAGAGFPLHDLRFCAQPIVEVLTIFAALCLIELIRAAADLFFEISRFALNRHRWFLDWMRCHGGTPHVQFCGVRVRYARSSSRSITHNWCSGTCSQRLQDLRLQASNFS